MKKPGIDIKQRRPRARRMELSQSWWHRLLRWIGAKLMNAGRSFT